MAKFIKYIAEGINFDKLVREQKEISSKLFDLYKTLKSTKSSAELINLGKKRKELENSLDKLGAKFKGMGIEVRDTADLFKEYDLRDQLNDKSIDKELRNQIKEEIKVEKAKKEGFERQIHARRANWQRFQVKYWGLTGKAIKWITRLSGTAIAVKALRDGYKAGDSMQRAQIETTGKLEGGMTRWAINAEKFAQVRNTVEGVMKAYSIEGVDIDEMTRKFVAYSGPDRQKAEELFSRLAASARISNMDFKEVWGNAEHRLRRYGESLDEAASNAIDMVSIVDGVRKEVEDENLRDGVNRTGTTIFRKEYLKAVSDATKEIEESGGLANSLVIAKVFGAGVKAGNSLRMSAFDTQKLAKDYIKFLGLDETVGWNVGLELLKKVEAEIGAKMRGRSSLEEDRVTREVIRNHFGEGALNQAVAIYKVAKKDMAYMFAASDFAKLYTTSSPEGAEMALKINLEAIKHGSDAVGMALLTKAGMTKADAVAAVVAVKAGNLNSLNESQRAFLTGSGYRKEVELGHKNLQKGIIEGAKSVFGDVWLRSTQVLKDPLGQLAIGLGIMGWTFKKEIGAAISLVRKWGSLALSYLGWAGIEGSSSLKSKASSLLSGLKGGKGTILKFGLGIAATAGIAYALNKITEIGEKQAAEVQKIIEPSKPIATTTTEVKPAEPKPAATTTTEEVKPAEIKSETADKTPKVPDIKTPKIASPKTETEIKPPEPTERPVIAEKEEPSAKPITPEAEPTKRQSTNVEPTGTRTPLAMDLAKYLSTSKMKPDLKNTKELMSRNTSIDAATERAVSQISREDVLSRDKVVRSSVVKAMGGTIVDTPKGEKAEMQISGFMHTLLSTRYI